MNEADHTASEALIQEISTALNESNHLLLQKVVEIAGVERTRAFLEKAVEIEAGGGLMVRNKSRRRTPGGVFFQLVREGVNAGERKLIFANQAPHNDPNAPPPPPPVKPPTWAQAQGIATKLLSAAKGEAIVKLTVIGRPKQVAKAQTCIVCMMEGRSVPQGMPKGLPVPPPTVKQNVAVYIAEKQWRKVEASLKEHKDDELIIDGWPYFDTTKQVTVLLAQGVTTKLIQRGRKEKQSVDGEIGKPGQGKTIASKRPARNSIWLVFLIKPRLSMALHLEVQIAVAKTNKYAVNESGDTVEVVERPHGGMSIVVADGQRSGKSAKAISNIVVRKAISLLAEGVRDGAVARATHDYLVTQRGGKVSAELSIVSLDLVTNTLVISRNARCPTLLRHGDSFRWLDEPAEAIGIHRHTKPSITELTVAEGLAVIVFTDGIWATGSPTGGTVLDLPTLLQQVDPVQMTSAQIVADAILAEALRLDSNRPHDDATVLVVKVLSMAELDTTRRLFIGMRRKTQSVHGWDKALALSAVKRRDL